MERRPFVAMTAVGASLARALAAHTPLTGVGMG